MAQKYIHYFKEIIAKSGIKYWLLIGIGIVVGVVVSSIFLGKHSKNSDPHAGHEMAGSEQQKKIKYWTCSMHPQIKLPKEGKCPICAMNLIPVYEDGPGSSEGEAVSLTLSDVGRRLAEVETAEAQFREVYNEVRLVGKVDYEETRLAYISAWIPGRIDRLYVDFTGTKVRKGDHLIKLYSPELLATQEEYLQAVKNWEETKKSRLSVIRDTAKATLKSVREKLRLYGITQKQIQEIVRKGSPNEHMTIYSPTTGTVIHKNGFEGMYVKTGDKIYTIADLSKLWLFLDAYESDIQWLHYGQDVTVETESYPGEIFRGKIAFIDPFVQEKTRTIKLRVNLDNKDEKLKPGMFVRAIIKSVIGAGSKIYEQKLAGKWICPMHPDVIKDHQAPCDICGMDLIRTSEFGFADKPDTEKKVLVIPKTAPLITGKRAVVYVEEPAKEASIHRYVGREVVLGPRAGDYYIVLSGLRAGEKVVTKGNFKIDSALQIEARPSMMNPAGYYSEKDGVLSQDTRSPVENAGVLIVSFPYYLVAANALSEDNPHEAAQNLEKFRDSIEDIIKRNRLEYQAEGIGLEMKQLMKNLNTINHDLPSLRSQFFAISKILKEILEKYEYKEDLKLYLYSCPMAFEGKRGYWLYDSDEIKNPYFGAKMLKCGEIQGEYGRIFKKRQPMGGHQHH